MTAPDILYGRTPPITPPVFASGSGQLSAKKICAKLMQVELPKTVLSISAHPFDLYQLIAKLDRNGVYQHGIPEEFKDIPAIWMTCFNDLAAMRREWPDMTEGPTKHYQDDTEFFATMSASLIAKDVRPRLMITGFADEEGPLRAPARTQGEYSISFALIERHLERARLPSIRRVW